MCDEKDIQCCAPINPITDYSYSARCENKIYKGYHCQVHFDKANELYKTYKDICKVAYQFHPEQVMTNVNNLETIRENIKYLFKCHVWYEKAYESRSEHKNYAFTPEKSDEGHNYQFEWIQGKIDISNEKLKLLYEKANQLKIKETKRVSKKGKVINKNEIKQEIDKSENEEIETIINKMNDFKKKQQEDEKETKKLMEKYMAENMKVRIKRLKTRNVVVPLFDEFIFKSGYDDETEITKFHLRVALFEIVRRLYDHNYFDDSFVPVRSECKCCRFVPLQTQLACDCIVRYEDFDQYVDKFLRYTHQAEVVKLVSTLIVKYYDKILPILNDFAKLYKIYGIQILHSKTSFVYNGERFTFSDEYETHEKNSKYLSLFRLNKKKRLEIHNEREFDSEILREIERGE